MCMNLYENVQEHRGAGRSRLLNPRDELGLILIYLSQSVSFLIILHIFVTKNFLMTAGLASSSPHVTRYCSAMQLPKEPCLCACTALQACREYSCCTSWRQLLSTSFRQQSYSSQISSCRNLMIIYEGIDENQILWCDCNDKSKQF